jgi:hypothetical protein
MSNMVSNDLKLDEFRKAHLVRTLLLLTYSTTQSLIPILFLFTVSGKRDELSVTSVYSLSSPASG